MKWLLVLVVVLMGSPGDAQAFRGFENFEKSANEGGGGGSYYTGSSRSRGYTCDICHVDADREIEILFDAEPSDLLEGFYQPGQTYRIDLRMLNHHRDEGLFNPNTFVTEIGDDKGQAVAGNYTWSNATDFILLDDGQVLASRATADRVGADKSILLIAAFQWATAQAISTHRFSTTHGGALRCAEPC